MRELARACHEKPCGCRQARCDKTAGRNQGVLPSQHPAARQGRRAAGGCSCAAGQRESTRAPLPRRAGARAHQDHVNGGAQPLDLLHLQHSALQQGGRGGAGPGGWPARGYIRGLCCRGGHSGRLPKSPKLDRRLQAARKHAPPTLQQSPKLFGLQCNPSLCPSNLWEKSPGGGCPRACRWSTNMRRSTMSDCVSFTISCSRSGMPAGGGGGGGGERSGDARSSWQVVYTSLGIHSVGSVPRRRGPWRVERGREGEREGGGRVGASGLY